MGGLSTPAVAGEAAGRAILVMDSSVAMQGALGNETKMEAVKNALGALLQRYDSRVDLGLAVYGSRKAKACEDVAVLSPPQTLKAPKLARLIAPLKASGASPLALALSEAAAAFGSAGPKDRVVLVTGGPDACDADPCVIAKQARAERQLKIDVVAIAGEGEDLKPLRCIATQSGGFYYEAGNAAKLFAALDKAMGQAAAASREEETASVADAAVDDSATPGLEPDILGESGQAGSPVSAPLPADDPENAVTADGKMPTLFSALVAEAGPSVDTGLTWRVYERKAGDDGLHKIVARSEDAAPRIPLAAGDYLVNVSYGRAYLTRQIKVVPGRATHEIFVLNAGGLRLNARTADGQAIAPAAVVNEIYSDERDQAGNRQLIVAGIRPGVILRLNAGLYHVKSTYGDANGVVQGDISIEAGRLTELTLSHVAANVTLKLVTETGGEALADTQWRIYTPEGTLVRESVGALPTHILAPGRYTVEAQRSGQKYAEAFEVAPGKARTVEVVVPQE